MSFEKAFVGKAQIYNQQIIQKIEKMLNINEG